MRPQTLLLVFLTLSCKHPISSSSYTSRIGVAVRLNNRICMAIRNPKLLPGATITLIAPADAAKNIPPQNARAQVLSRQAETCPGSKADSTSDTYNLIITSGSVQQDVPLVALDARVPSVYAAHSFHECNSAGGVELTAWDGAKPLEGRLLWRQFYDLGQRTDATCTAPETLPY